MYLFINLIVHTFVFTIYCDGTWKQKRVLNTNLYVFIAFFFFFFFLCRGTIFFEVSLLRIICGEITSRRSDVRTIMCNNTVAVCIYTGHRTRISRVVQKMCNARKPLKTHDRNILYIN